jgi:hypothetical protein
MHRWRTKKSNKNSLFVLKMKTIKQPKIVAIDFIHLRKVLCPQKHAQTIFAGIGQCELENIQFLQCGEFVNTEPQSFLMDW